MWRWTLSPSVRTAWLAFARGPWRAAAGRPFNFRSLGVPISLHTLSEPFWNPTHPSGGASSTLFPVITPTTARPDLLARPGVNQPGDGIVGFAEKAGSPGAECPFNLMLYPYAVGEPGGQFDVAVYGWTPTSGTMGGVGGTALWVPVLLSWFTAFLGSALGIDGAEIPSQFRFAGSVLVNYGLGDFVRSGLAVVEVPSLGHRLLEVTFQSGGLVNQMNCLYRKR